MARVVSKVPRTPASPATGFPEPPPPEGATFSIHELVRGSRVPLRTIRYYVARKALPPPEFRSLHTRYDRAFLIRLRAIAHLRGQKLRLAAIGVRLEAASPDELLRLAGYAVPEPPPAPVPEPASTMAAGVAPRRLLPEMLGPYRTGAAHPSERWEHHEVCPGVRLLIRTEADAEAWRVAREILATFAAPS